MRFDVAGPFPLTRHGKKRLITEQTRKDLKPDLEAHESGLSAACGCYVFAVQAGLGFTPFYVGKSCKASVWYESLNPSNRGKYNEALDDYESGTPVLFLVPMRTKRGKFRKPKDAAGTLASVDFLERWLIAEALKKNPRLINDKHTRFLRDLHVVGIFNAAHGEATKSSMDLSRAIWKS